MAAKVRNEPSASVETPVMPWPMVQPSAITPPSPISAAPARLRSVSPVSEKVVMRNRPMASAAAKAPMSAPNTLAVPKPGMGSAVNSTSHCRASPVGRT